MCVWLHARVACDTQVRVGPANIGITFAAFWACFCHGPGSFWPSVLSFPVVLYFVPYVHWIVWFGIWIPPVSMLLLWCLFWYRVPVLCVLCSPHPLVFILVLCLSLSASLSVFISVYCVVFNVHILVSVFSVSCPPCSVTSNCPQLRSPCVPTSLITFCVFMSEYPFVLCCVVPLGCVHLPCLPSASALVSPSIVLYDFLCSC